jgi:hypothetical protein
MKRNLILFLVFLALAVVSFFFFEKAEAPGDAIDAVDKSAQKVDLIVLVSPLPGEKIASPLTLTGSARGYWYFEASFPVELRDSTGALVAGVAAQAQSEWMTEEFVPFKAELLFPTQPPGGTGTLHFKRDNPSGDPERDDELVVPILF